MYLEDRDMDKTMDIYYSAWKKGLKSTYYLHMKPRHTAEQSTVSVNKSAKLGKTGFAGVFRKETPAISEPAAALQEENSGVAREEVIEKEQDQILDMTPIKEVISQNAATFSRIEPISSEIKPVSHQIFSKVQTQLPQPTTPNIQNLAPKEGQFQEKIIDGKVYRVHMPSDPQEKFLCDGCQ